MRWNGRGGIDRTDQDETRSDGRDGQDRMRWDKIRVRGNNMKRHGMI